MLDPISDLLGIIREETSLYRDFLENARRKTSLLVQGSVEAILENNQAEETLSARLRELELEMARRCNDLSRAFRIPREEVTLMKLAESLEPSLALEIRAQTALLRDLIKQLKSISRRNLRLIEKSVHYAQGLLALIANASGSYRPNGLFEQIPSIQPTFSQQA
jgi:hypothetical protein